MKKILEETIKLIRKQYGNESLTLLGEDSLNKKVKTIPTGSLLLNQALGGGYPLGRVIEIYGPESAGKTTLALQVIAEVQKSGETAAFIDAEHALDPDYAKKIGIKLEELFFVQPDSGEQALDIAESLIKSGNIKLIVIDSVAALVPEVELKGEMNDQTIGVQARLMSKALRKLSPLLNQNNCTLIFINQLREKIGVIFGNPEITPGGRALKFYASQRIEVRKGERIVEANELIGQHMNIKVVKNKIYTPFKTVKLKMIYGKGISRASEIADLCVEKEIIKKSGCWYSYNGEKVAQGKKMLDKWIASNNEIYNELNAKFILIK